MTLIYNTFKRLLNKNNQLIDILFNRDYENQKKILDRFDSPQNLLERSFFQYQCQSLNKSIFVRLVENLLAILAVLYYLVKPYSTTTQLDTDNNKNKAVFLREGVTKDIIPNSLKDEFKLIYESSIMGSVFLDKNDKKFILKNFFKYFNKPFFTLKCVLKIGIYSNVIHMYQPNAIITHNEYSYASSALTEYCRSIGVKHFNVMHGEKLFDINDAFVEFDKFYVWDQHYVELFIELCAEKEQFLVEAPKSVIIDLPDVNEYEYEMTYYLGGEDEENLINLRNRLINIKIPIEKICIRYHPRYCDERQIRRIFYGFKVEDPNRTPLSISIFQTKYVASLYSTVLFQAYKSGKCIVIDDMTDSIKYEKLKSLKYIMMNKPHLLLSQF